LADVKRRFFEVEAYLVDEDVLVKIKRNFLIKKIGVLYLPITIIFVRVLS
jgi:hypothetical protein